MSLCVFSCVCLCMHFCACCRMYVEDRGQIVGVHSFLPPHKFQEQNCIHLAGWQVLLPMEIPNQLPIVIYPCTTY